LERKEFITNSLCLSACCGAMIVMGKSLAEGKEVSPKNSPLSDCEKKQEFARGWIERLMNSMDENLDQGTRRKLMEACGRACYCAAHGEKDKATNQPVNLDQFLADYKKKHGESSVKKEGNEIVLFFKYPQKQSEKQAKENLCWCPLVEDGPEKLSDTYCYCSVGYVKEVFERSTGKEVKVDLLSAVKRGDKDCSFAIRLS